SSFISVAAGLEHPSAGEVHLFGQSLSGKNENQLARLRRGRVSLVFQSFHLLPTSSALDNVQLPLEIAKLDRVKERAIAALADVGLSDRLQHYPGQLSGGERQRVAVARALASSPELIFADEPTGNLDQASGTGVADLLFAMARKQKACLILVTHDPELAKRADRIVSMSDGILTCE
ncbi:ABC-type antimicrobial peptide transport system, ATPase component, partial [hydrothermal vent metagenome]